MMRRFDCRQEGATLLVVMVMLILMTLMSLAAYKLSSTNQRVVANTQFRQEAISAVDVAINRYIHTGVMSENVVVNGNAYAISSPNLATPQHFLRPLMNKTEAGNPSVETMDNWMEKWVMDDGVCAGYPDPTKKLTPMEKRVCDLHAGFSAAELEKRKRIFTQHCNPDRGAGGASAGGGSGLIVAAGLGEVATTPASSGGMVCSLPCYYDDLREIEVTVTDSSTSTAVTIVTGYSNGELKTVEELRSAGLCS